MTFISFNYLLLFLPLIVLLYHVFRKTFINIGGKTTVANICILGFSYFFYGIAEPWYILPLLVTSLIDFWVGIRLSKTEHPFGRKALLICSLVANLGLLAFFKYTPWLIETTNMGLAALGIAWAIPMLAVTLPPGISFYTFQTMSYTIEVYRREMAAARNIVDYLAFVTFWPHLVAGPIMRARDLLRQLEVVRPVITADETRYALMLIVWGLFKKIVLADNFGHITESLESSIAGNVVIPGAGLLFAYAFAGQIYCDFSAYTDIARGSAKLIGVELVRNFNTPYFATSPSDFWRRWHISLSTWLRDYLYIPLGGNRHGKLVEYRALLLTMLLGGLWHGAGILFVLWGAWHGLLLVIYKIFPIEAFFARFGRLGTIVSVLITFHLVCFGWILFRAQVTTVMPLLGSIGDLFTADNFSLFYLYGRGVLFLGSLVLISDYIGYRKGGEFPDLFKSMNLYTCVGIAVFCYFMIMVFGRRQSAQFIYFQF